MKKTIYNLCDNGTLNFVVAVIFFTLSLIERTNRGIYNILSIDFDVAFWANIILAELKANKE
jgi:hypothetical protein